MDKDLSSIRRQYGNLSLDQTAITESPFDLLQVWFSDYLNLDNVNEVPMVLSTVDEFGNPDSRVVLLKNYNDNQLIFYTNYHSVKGKQMELNPFVALNFYWHALARQVRIRGKIHKISSIKSDEYFYSRPVASQVASIVSEQSQVIESRLALEKKIQQILSDTSITITRPQHWGGYAVSAHEIEFWQGRDNRISDRVKYVLQTNEQWINQRLAP